VNDHPIFGSPFSVNVTISTFELRLLIFFFRSHQLLLRQEIQLLKEMVLCLLMLEKSPSNQNATKLLMNVTDILYRFVVLTKDKVGNFSSSGGSNVAAFLEGPTKVCNL
jgi:hypothetical protein